MQLTANWSYPTQVRFGAGRINEIAASCIELGIRRPLLVTDVALADQPITHNTLSLLRHGGLDAELFSDITSNPLDNHLKAGVTAYRTGGHDGVIAFGGGSGLDMGKGIAFMQAQSREVWDFEDREDWWQRANADEIAPIIAVPTTAGTGSEMGRAFVLTNSKTHQKKVIFHPKVLPSTVICDPKLTVGMPRFITAGTGMDALAHCLEAYCSPMYHPFSQGIALEGMRLVKENLELAFSQPENICARSHMMSAAAMGAIAFQKGLGAIHALSHPIGARFNTHHGTTNAVFMPHVLAFNRQAIEGTIERAAAYIGIEGGFDGFCLFVNELNRVLGIAPNLRELGVTSNDWDLLIAEALADPSAAGNPIELDATSVASLYQAAW